MIDRKCGYPDAWELANERKRIADAEKERERQLRLLGAERPPAICFRCGTEFWTVEGWKWHGCSR